MDALAMVYNTPKTQPVFLACDIFKKIRILILYYLKMLPVFRIWTDSILRATEIFEKLSVLRTNGLNTS